MSQEIVLITGTSSGLGLCAAAMLAKHPSQKYKVYAGMRNTAKKDELLKKAEGCADKNLFVIQIDVCSDDSVNAAVKHVFEKEGKIDVLAIEPGPIATKFGPTALSQLTEFEPKDETTKVLFDKFMGNIGKKWFIEGVLQNGDECAEYILKAIRDEKHQLHYLTNKEFEGHVKIKFRDMAGRECLQDSIEEYLS